jgi:hypothetical protein
VWEGGFDRHDRFFFIALGANAGLTELWRHRLIAMFLDKGLLNPDFARKLLHGSHSGFSIDSGTRIYDEDARRSLSQYIVRAPLSLTSIHWDQDRDTVTWKAPQKGYFKGKERHFSCLDFIAQLTLHIPPRGRHLLRRYGLYSSRGRGTWKDRPALASRAPQHWYGRRAAQPPAAAESAEVHEVSAIDRRKAWARLLAMIYDVDPLGGSCVQSTQREPVPLSRVRKQDVRDRRHTRSRRDPGHQRMPCQGRKGTARGGMSRQSVRSYTRANSGLPNQVDRGLAYFGWTDGKAMNVLPAGKPEELRIGLDDAVGRA